MKLSKPSQSSDAIPSHMRLLPKDWGAGHFARIEPSTIKWPYLVVDGATTAPCPLDYNDLNLLFSLNFFTFNIKFLGFLTVGHSTVVGTTANHTRVGGSIPVPWPTISSLFPVHILLVALRRSDVLIDVYYKRPQTYKRLRILRWEIQWAHVWWYGITRLSRPLRG